MFNLIPKLQGFAVPKRAAIIYWAVTAAVIVILGLAGQSLPAILALGIGLCGFVLADVLMAIKNDPPTRRSRKIHTVFTCCLAGGALVFCIYMLIRYLMA